MNESNQENDRISGLVPIVLLLVVFGALLWGLLGTPRQEVAQRTADAAVEATALAALPTATPDLSSEPVDFTTADAAYAVACAACHGGDGRGVEGMGSDLTASALWGDSGALFDYLSADPAPVMTSGEPHPVQSNLNPAMTDSQLLQLVGYLYSLGR